MITSLQNAYIKNAARLRERRGRQKQGRFIIDGARELLRAMDAGVELVEVFIYELFCQSEASREVLTRLQGDAFQDGGPKVIAVTESVFGKVAFGERGEGVVGIAIPPKSTLADIAMPDCPLVAVLEGIEKPGNTGAILRSADAAGVSALITTGGGTDLYNPNCIRASLGTVFTMPVCDASPAEVLSWLKDQRIAVYAATVDASVPFTQAKLAEPAAIVLGSEAEGLSQAWDKKHVTPISLPMLGVADSLNVSATAAVLFYEAVRQRGHGRKSND
jgi:TrmH family RNA methyltransferase